ncbi:hypothetical protein O6H91_22G022300 [Diphasiastrum complanatum]|uniref:Uncharacterized protein n=2 Tax=Diphasiastrum complanatum TaxID=34168 RepID=A0ACC2ADN8_DIPCM|nr:hypothetical protein O6H91_22G022300 [Diphasiastrum complanatum]KAJ7515665.1 hypothetical protein O6H91_22G022300 [Diphasiastrum complanatum]
MHALQLSRVAFLGGRDGKLNAVTDAQRKPIFVEGGCFDLRKRSRPSKQMLWIGAKLEVSVENAKSVHDAKNVQKKDKVIVISGPTGVGKSRLAIALAKKLGGEIISADSVQVYKGLDVGSAKITQVDREGIPHHLLDLVHPTQEYTAAQFCDDARRATIEILSRKHIPIVVGGTGMYLRCYLYGKPSTPKPTEEVTAIVDAELSELSQKDDWEAAVELLIKAGDQNGAKTISRNDWYRLHRALTIIRETGFPQSSFPYVGNPTEKKMISTSNGLNGQQTRNERDPGSELDYNFMCYFLHATRRDELYRSIDLRCEEMLSDSIGLLTEASWLLDMGLQPNSSSPSRAIGYRQAMDYLSKCRKAGGISSQAEFLKFLYTFQHASRNYAKRQFTWFRKEHLFDWIDALQPLEKLIEFLADEYHKPAGVTMNSEVKAQSHSMSSFELERVKSYKSENRIFRDSRACSLILDWIKKSQSC